MGIADNINIGNRVILTAQSGVMNDIPDSDEFIWWSGTPAIQAFKNWKKVVLTQKQFPALISSLRKDVDFEGFKNRYFENIGSKEKKDE